jgi:hypothetical protein
MSVDPSLGPVISALLVTADLEHSRRAYEESLGLLIAGRGNLDAATAAALGYPQLMNHPWVMLANTQGRHWLLLVEDVTAPIRDHLQQHGWLAQEILVADVDRLATQLQPTHFKVLRPPANLGVSDRIRACQVQGPSGEVLYLTEVKGEVPPFELPICQDWVDHLFIPVLSTPDRAASLAGYELLARRSGLCFETRISVVNQAMQLPLETEHPVATLQLSGNALIEIDQIAGTQPAPAALCRGTAAIIFRAHGPAPAAAQPLLDGPLAGYALMPGRGVARETFVLAYGD